MDEQTNEVKHTAGRELDALIAEKVMGWTRYPAGMHPTDNRTISGVLYCPPYYPYDAGSANVVPYYSTNISEAWEVVTKLAERGLWMTMLTPFNAADGFHVAYTPHGEAQWQAGLGTVIADTAPLAICRAALKALDKETA
jgi:hypothetical protein